MEDVLRAIGREGPFFAISLGVGEEDGWRVLGRPVAGEWGPVIDAYAARLRTGEPRVAVSILFQGVAARLWTPALAAAAGYGVVPDLTDLRWRYTQKEGLVLRLPVPQPYPGDPASGIHETVTETLLHPLLTALTSEVKVSEPLMWGNAASALAGTLHTTPYPERTTSLVHALLNQNPLRNTGEFTPTGFRRRSCCLYYRVPPGGALCGDCALKPTP